MTRYNVTDKNEVSGQYGIKITKERIAENISDNLSVVEKIVNTCNREEVDYDSFDDVLENFLEDFESF